MSNSLTRVLVAVVAIPLAIAVVFQGGLALGLLVAALAVLGAGELLALARHQGVRPLPWVALPAAALFPLGVWALYGTGAGPLRLGQLNLAAAVPSAWYLVALLTLLVLAATLAARAPTERPLASAAITLLAPLHCGALPAMLLGIRYAIGPDRHWPATWAVFFPLAVTWVCDSAAMYGGRTFGGPRLAPVVSPGKTRSGAVAGLAGGVAAALAFNALALVPSGFTVPAWQAGLAGLVLAAVAQAGDLAESLFKREAGVKDSGHLIPGHGGVLDRLDSLYFVIPVAAVLYRLLGLI
jgi:phosphatidate cytidylyltransferase